MTHGQLGDLLVYGAYAFAAPLPRFAQLPFRPLSHMRLILRNRWLRVTHHKAGDEIETAGSTAL